MQVFTFWLTFPDQPDQGELVFARGQERAGFTAARDAFQQAQEYAQQSGRDAKFTSTDFGMGVDENQGKAAAGAKMIGRTPGGAHSVKVLGVMSGLGSPLMSDFFGGRDVGGGAVSDTGQGMFSNGTFSSLPDPTADRPGPLTLPTESLAPDELEFQRAQFYRGLEDRGLPTRGLTGRALERAYDPTFNRFLFQNIFDPATAENFDPEVTGTTTQPAFASFVQNQPLYGSAASEAGRQQFLQALEASRGISPGAGAVGGFEDPSRGLTAAQQDLLNPQTAQQAQTLESLARQAARSRLGVGAELFGGGRNWFDQYAGQAKPSALSFAEFLNKRIFGGR